MAEIKEKEMPLTAVMDTLEGVDESIAALYTQKGEKFELTGIAGVKTQADVDRLTTSLNKEREEHKTTKASLGVWGELNHEEVMAKLDKIPELEAAAAGKLDEAAIEEIVNKRVQGTIATQTAPLERQVAALTKERDEFAAQNEGFRSKDRTRNIHDAVRKELVDKKVIPEAHDDALMLADRIFEVREDDGAIVTRDNVGVTPGITPDLWLQEIQEKRPHWWPASQGGGAGGGQGGGGVGSGASNPFTAEGWNVTEQGNILRLKGREHAERMAKAAGTTVGGKKPAPRKS
ncbi:gp66 [Alphaproteobacteria phage PhiJL001]|uniref:Gp66 n=1 Tax=Alphaproteobacteria phage PhiJL001 TaxID=2681607 RepID=Q5DN39_9CAUD|nr:head scaffolding protein [Alphaproteobacteria phage PhiJL001]AAT69542.1 gp66 [Alphaproteobacteria phage PhiJL001]